MIQYPLDMVDVDRLKFPHRITAGWIQMSEMDRDCVRVEKAPCVSCGKSVGPTSTPQELENFLRGTD